MRKIKKLSAVTIEGVNISAGNDIAYNKEIFCVDEIYSEGLDVWLHICDTDGNIYEVDGYDAYNVEDIERI